MDSQVHFSARALMLCELLRESDDVALRVGDQGERHPRNRHRLLHDESRGALLGTNR